MYTHSIGSSLSVCEDWPTLAHAPHLLFISPVEQ